MQSAHTMTRLLLAGMAVLGTWTLLDTVAHRLLLQPLYVSSPSLWRPLSEMNPVLIGAVTVLLMTVFLAAYTVLVRPKSLAAGLCFGGLLGVALGASAGFGTSYGQNIRTRYSTKGYQLAMIHVAS
jgi:hypothetical protein